MSVYDEDRKALREVARRYAEIAGMECHAKTVEDWKKLNSLRPARPMIMIDQIPWEEMDVGDELTLRCSDPFLQSLEWSMRSEIYKWNHFKCDMVFLPHLQVPKVYTSTGYGVNYRFQDGDLQHENAMTHTYFDQIPDEAAIEKLRVPDIAVDEAANASREALALDMFGDILPVYLSGISIWASIWDRLVYWRGATPVLYDLIDRPEFTHKLMGRIMEIDMAVLDRYEELNLLETKQETIHCCGAFTDELPKQDQSAKHVSAKQCWVAGAAQIFSEVSPAMHNEYEIEYLMPYYERFGLVNYGCCEPLHNKIGIIRKIKNVRAISVSPWADVNVAAQRMGGDYVMARKPNPSFVAMDRIDDRLIIDETAATLKACRDNNTPCEFILKDISTVRNEPQRLTRWYNLVKATIDNF